MQTDQVPKGLALLKGFSVFNPDDTYIEEFKETWGVKLDFLDEGEKLLWIGAPDFRYSLISFGQPILKYYFFPIFFITIVSFMAVGFGINPISVSALIVFALIFFNIIFSASMYFGVLYGVSKNRIFILYVENLPKNITSIARFNLRKAKSTTIYYDIGYINDMSMIKLRGSNVGSLFFNKSINGGGTPRDWKEKPFRALSVRNVFFLQHYVNDRLPFDHFVAIHDAECVAGTIDSIRRERLEITEKILWLK